MLEQHLAAVLDAIPTLDDVLQVALTNGTGYDAKNGSMEFQPEYDNEGYGRNLLSKRKGTCNLEPPYKGTAFEKKANTTLQWLTFSITVACLAFYSYEGYKGHVGWEEIYVALVECGKVAIEVYNEWSTPASIYQTNGSTVLWLRYAEWLLSCPVILVHLSNMTGLTDKYGTKTLLLILSDVGCITMGVTCAFAQGPIKVLFFMIACCYGAVTYFGAAKIYIQTYHTVPKGRCRLLVKVMAWVYFTSWLTFPVFFVAGPEGLGKLTLYGTTIAHTFGDLCSKNLWGFLGHFLRCQIREHLLLHGDVRKKMIVNVAGEEVEIETFVEHTDEGIEGAVRHPGNDLARRASFVKIRETLKKRGHEPRLSVDGQSVEYEEDVDEEQPIAKPAPPVPKAKGRKSNDAAIEPGRVMLITPDLTVAELFRQQFASLPASVELVTAASVEMAMPLIQQSLMMGGLDFILLHPELLRDTSPQGSLAKLRMMGQRVAAFGWGAHSPMRQLIESAGLDAWLEGPSFGVGVKTADLASLVTRMQGLKKSMSSGMQGGMGGMQGSMGGMQGGMGGMQGGMGGMQGGMGGMMASMASMGAMAGNAMGGGMGGMGMMGGMQGMNAGMMQQAASGNPLYNSAGTPPPASPLATMSAGSFSLGRNSLQLQGASTPPGGSSVTEADVLAQLMQEISRLKSELGEHP